MKTLTKNNNWATVSLIAAILLVAMNLRVPFTGVAPVLPWIQHDLSLSTTAVGLLTSLPLLAFAAFSPFAASIASRFGLERTLLGALGVIAAGVVIRSGGSVWTLYSGTVFIGAGIALGNVLLPSLIKRDFPAHLVSLTGAYSITMGAAGAIGSAAVIPLTQAWGWRAALAMFVIVPLVALLAWLPQWNKQGKTVGTAKHQAPGVAVWRSPLAWQVSLFMGLNAMPFYIAVAWLPTILMEHGISATAAGSLHGTLQLATAVPGLLMAAILRRMKDQRAAAVIASSMSAISLMGLMLAPSLALLWAVLLGFGCGASMILGLTFIGLRTVNARDAAALSGMAQCVGYLMAAAGPMMLGGLHDVFGGWSTPLLLASVVTLVGAWSGMLAGRAVHL